MSDRRTVAKLIRFYPAELALITAHASVCRQTPARYIRETALGATPKHRHRNEVEPIVHELAGVANQLHDVKQGLRDTSYDVLADRIDAALKLHLAVMRRLLDDQPPRRKRRGRAE